MKHTITIAANLFDYLSNQVKLAELNLKVINKECRHSIISIREDLPVLAGNVNSPDFYYNNSPVAHLIFDFKYTVSGENKSFKSTKKTVNFYNERGVKVYSLDLIALRKQKGLLGYKI